MNQPLPEGHARDIRAALDTLKRRQEPSGNMDAIVHRATIGSLSYALIDHDDPEVGCLTVPGTECVAVTMARRILAEDTP